MWNAVAVCGLVVVLYYSCPPFALVLPVLLAIGVCRHHITVYVCVQLNSGCNDLLTVLFVPPRRAGLEFVLFGWDMALLVGIRPAPMGPHGAPWGPMGPHGALWGPMGPYGAP